MGIVVENLSYMYSEVEVLKNISFSIESGEWVSIVGHNGSGKSTLAKILCTLLEFEHGNITIDETAINLDNLLSVRRFFGVVFQNPDNQFVGTTVFDDVAFGLQNIGLLKEEIYYRVDKYLEIVGMSGFKHREPHTLSGGQKQRVAIAASLALEPKYLIFDEATAMLDPTGRNDIINLIKHVHSLGTTIISITHDLDEAIQSDRIIALNAGEIVFNDTPNATIDHCELFNEIGVLIPFALRLSTDLIAKGLDIKLCVSEEELGEQLCQLGLKM